MDFKRNARYFSKTFSRNITILAVIGVVLAIGGGLLWWYVYLGSFAIIVEIIAIASAIMAVAAFSQRPSEKDLLEQIETAEKRFRDEAMDAYGYPVDAENCTRLVWGFVPGSVEKTTKGGKKVTDRPEFALIWLKKGELAVYRKTTALLMEESEVTDVRLSLRELTATLERETGVLTLYTPDETLTLSVFEPDYKLEEFLNEITHRKGK